MKTPAKDSIEETEIKDFFKNPLFSDLPYENIPVQAKSP